MPYRKAYRKPTYKKKYAPRRRAPARRRATVPFKKMGVPSGMPATRTSKLRFCTSKVIECQENTIGYANFLANGVFDPDTDALPAGQPMGFDQWASLYDQYCVVGSKITAYITYQKQESYSAVPNSNVNPPCMVGIYCGDDAAVPYTNWQGLVESKRGTFRNITAYQGSPVKVSSKFSCRKFFNLKNPMDNILRVGADNTSNPTETATYIIWGNTTGALAPDQKVKLNCNIIIDFIVRWSEPKDLSRS